MKIKKEIENKKLIKRVGTKEWFAFAILILLITDVAIFLNIPFFRQILGFLFLTILPGLLILQILKLDKLGFTEKFVLSVGLSISFLLFFGLLINNLSLSLGYERPLATIPLLISLNIIFIVLAIIGYRVNKDTTRSLPNFDLSTSEKAFLIVPILFPALSIFGMHVMNTTDNNIILMFLFFLIPAYVVFVCFFNHKFPKRLYPVVIFLISISLLLILMLRFPHIYGGDVHTEYYLFRRTLNNLHWSIFEYSLLNACLSISLLPTIFQSIMNVNAQEYLFRGVYVSICSFAPLAIYLLSKKYISELYAFLASFFFISQSNFLLVAASPRTNIAIFFTALAVMVFFSDKIDPLKRRILFIVFMLSIVVSHYSTTYIFFFIILFTWFALEIFSKRDIIFKKKITLTLVLLFFAFIFLWYSQVTETAFNAGVGFVEETFMNLNNFFIEESRNPALEGLYGQGLQHGIISKVDLAVTWSIFIFIGIGVLNMLKRYKEMIVLSNVKHKNPDFLKTKFEMEYLIMVLACAGLLIITVALPYISTGYGIDRLYSMMLVILSVCFVIGGMTLSHFLSKERTRAKKETLFAKQKAFMEKCYRSSFGKAFLSKKRFVLKEKQKSLIKNFSLKKTALPKKQKEGRKENAEVRAYLIILLILIPHFLFVTGAMHQISGVPASITLNSCGEIYDRDYLFDQESCAAKWLMINGEKNSQIYTTDGFGKHTVISQGKISPHQIDTSSFSNHRKCKGYIYLGYNNVVNDKLVVKGRTADMGEYSDMFIEKNKIYGNRVSEIYK